MGNANEGSFAMTQIDAARAGVITPEMKTVAAKEFKTEEEIRAGVACGRIAI
ncbi:MAG: phosphomethylpyrimidine synthase ThiC, partial [Raoultibacter sp.]